MTLSSSRPGPKEHAVPANPPHPGHDDVAAAEPSGAAAVRIRLPVGDEPASLCDALDTLLDRGVVVSGDIRIKVADVDLLYLRLDLLATSVETLRRHAQAEEP